jgi:hypothetical protein
MIPTKLDITIWRGISFELELISQIKNFTYDPAIHTSTADLKRTHTQNLEYYGFVYEYIDFLTTYASAELIIRKPWIKAGQQATDPLMTLAVLSGLELTSNSVKIAIAAADTAPIEFDAGTYELLLTTATGKVDGLIFGDVTVLGKIQ